MQCKLHAKLPNITTLIVMSELHIDPLSLAAAKGAAAGPCHLYSTEPSKLAITLSEVMQKLMDLQLLHGRQGSRLHRASLGLSCKI